MSLVDKIKENIPKEVFAVGVFVIFVGSVVGIGEYLNIVKRKNLAPNAIHLGKGSHVLGEGLSIYRENIDKDPREESVLKFYDKDGKQQMVEIYWDENHYPKIGFQEDNPTIPYSEK
jgi:hypothetical protein